jgi:hypothetical protein
MATLKITKDLVNYIPSVLDAIKAHFDTVYIFAEKKDFTVYHVENNTKIGDFEIVVEFVDIDGVTTISKFYPVSEAAQTF